MGSESEIFPAAQILATFVGPYGFPKIRGPVLGSPQ